MLVYKQGLPTRWFLRKFINSSCFKPLIWVVISMNSLLSSSDRTQVQVWTLTRCFHRDIWTDEILTQNRSQMVFESFSLLQQQQFISLNLNLAMESSQFSWTDGNCWCLLKGFSSSTQRHCPDSRVHFLPDVKYGFFSQVFHFPPTSIQLFLTPSIKTEAGVPLVYFFPLPMVALGETKQFPPAKLVVSFLSYPFSLVNWKSFSCRKSNYFATA